MTLIESGDRLTWRKAERPADQRGNCVCVAADGDQTGIRDSKEGPSGTALWTGPADRTASRSHLTR